MHAHLGYREDSQPQRHAGAQSSDVLATQNDIAVRTTARASPIAWIPTSDSAFRPGQRRAAWSARSEKQSTAANGDLH